MADAFPEVWLIRHGETAWSRSGQHTGRTDIPLTERGEQMASALRTRLQGHTFAHVLCSPLLRARRTAELAGFAEVLRIEPDLMEWHYGAYEGRRTAEIRAERPVWSLYEDGCPGGETAADVAHRAERVIAQLRRSAADTLIFAHRDILRILTARWLALPAETGQRFNLEPTSISILGSDHTPDEPLLRSLNIV